MRSRHKVVLISVVVVAVGVTAWRFIPASGSGPVTVAFVRYERAGRDWHAYMELRNDSSRSIFYHSGGMTSTHYFWDSPQIEYEGLRESRFAELPAKSNALFRVLVMTTEHDWRVGVDCEIAPPSWSAHLPAWLREFGLRVGIIKSGTVRAWSARVKKPAVNDMTNNPAARAEINSGRGNRGDTS